MPRIGPAVSFYRWIISVHKWKYSMQNITRTQTHNLSSDFVEWSSDKGYNQTKVTVLEKYSIITRKKIANLINNYFNVHHKKLRFETFDNF